MAAALSLTFGRTGALVGNLIFGFLIDMNCVMPIVIFSAMLFGEYKQWRGHWGWHSIESKQKWGFDKI